MYTIQPSKFDENDRIVPAVFKRLEGKIVPASCLLITLRCPYIFTFLCTIYTHYYKNQKNFICSPKQDRSSCGYNLEGTKNRSCYQTKFQSLSLMKINVNTRLLPCLCAFENIAVWRENIAVWRENIAVQRVMVY